MCSRIDRGLLWFSLFFFLVLTVFVSAQDYGCCCNPLTYSGSLETEASCNAKSYLFKAGLPERGLDCDDVCEALLLTPRTPVCGDGVCEGDESVTCPSDCATPSQKALLCGTPGYYPAPTNFIVEPIKGEKKFRLSFDTECPSAYTSIFRSKDGSTFQLVKTITDNSYIDEDSDLEFDVDYNYSIFSYYIIGGGRSKEVTASSNLGDLECWNNDRSLFCLNIYFYRQYKDYLKNFGYAGRDGAYFELNFDSYVASVFSSRLNSAYSCTDKNKLVLQSSCDDSSDCLIRDSLPVCIKTSECNNTGPFGLFSSLSSCETDPDENLAKFCFFDVSDTIVDSCYDCVQGMSCYDYKSRSACERNNCGAGSCEWHVVDSDINSGVCVDADKSNCDYCGTSGTEGMDNSKAFNNVFGVCDEDSAIALSVPGYSCFYHKDERVVLGCGQATCRDYSEFQCNSPVYGIQLDSDNSLVSMSSDSCGIGVCEFDKDNNVCRKDARGSSGFDCPLEDYELCEADYFTPKTSLIPSGVNHVDFLDIVILDKQSKIDKISEHTSEAGYDTFLCLKTSLSSCSNAKSFSLKTNSSRLIVKNLVLKDGQTKLADLSEGDNILLFYSKDPYNNLEVVKSVNFSACKDCQGPTLLDVSITGGKFFGSVLYSSLKSPKITLVFDEPTKISSASLSNSQINAEFGRGYSYEHVISFDQALSEETYRLVVNAENEKGISVPAPGLFFSLTIDSSLSSVDVVPSDGSVLSDGSVVDFRITFSKSSVLKEVVLTRLNSRNEYLLLENSTDIISDFETSDDFVFTASLANLNNGAYKLFVEAEDINGLPVAKETRFFVGEDDDFINLIYPRFGVSPTLSFNAKFESALKSECRYAFGLPSKPSVDSSTFSSYTIANSADGYSHTTSVLNIPYGSSASKKLYVFCRHGSDIKTESFDLSADALPPKLVSAYAFPDIIAEESYGSPGTYSTFLKVETDKASFCKYSSKTSDFEFMEYEFPGFDFSPKKSHSISVVVDEKKSYVYFVSCESPAGVASSAESISFSVDLSKGLDLDVVSPSVVDTLNFSIGVETNKVALCHFGESPFNIAVPFGEGAADYVHRQDFKMNTGGVYKFYIRCIVPRTGETSSITKETVIIDQVPPKMLWVNSSSILPDKDVSYFSNRLRVAYKGEDVESGISHYLISVVRSLTDAIVLNDSKSYVLDGNYTYVENLSLSDQTSYKVVVSAVDKAGLVSLPMSSDDVFINFSQMPSNCINNVKDGDETDVDCGGSCPSCDISKVCKINSDCYSESCVDKKCVKSTYHCKNDKKDGDETDVDCGGSCLKCSLGKKCYDDYDCSSDYCDISSGTCKNIPSCKDGKLSAGETGVDCGGPCDPCLEGLNCEVDSDCVAGLVCSDFVCTSEDNLDADRDGIFDGVDLCPNTPIGEVADESGCSPSQKFSLGDIIDDGWRLKYFGCIDCPEAAAKFDFDEDGLTNIQEYQFKTDPTRVDSDNDGWSDYEEVDLGTNPADSNDHPESEGLGFLGWFLILLLIAGVGVGGYLLYLKLVEKGMIKPVSFKLSDLSKKKKYFEKKIPSKQEIKPVLKPELKKEFDVDAFSKLKSFAKKELPEKDWVEIKGSDDADSVFRKLKKTLKESGKDDALDRLKKMKVDSDLAFDKLKKTVEEHKRKKNGK